MCVVPTSSGLIAMAAVTTASPSSGRVLLRSCPRQANPNRATDTHGCGAGGRPSIDQVIAASGTTSRSTVPTAK